MAEGDHAAAARHADTALAIELLERAAVETAMLARYAAGREHEAARALARYRDAADGYGVAPAADVVRLAESIAGDGALARGHGWWRRRPRPSATTRRSRGSRPSAPPWSS